MKREIKFRQPWISLKDDKFSHFTYWGRIDHKNNKSDDCFSSPSASSHHYTKEDQQFTGLLDKKGREIWEGDLIKINTGSIHDKELFSVGFRMGSFEMQPMTDDLPPLSFIYMAVQLREKGKIKYDYQVTESIEVIGNIYENPELL